MDATVLYAEDLHSEHLQWKLELDFWVDELAIFQNRLEELVQRWTNKNVLAELDQYQNQFLIHRTQIDLLQEDIQGHELNLAHHARAKKNVIDRIHYNHHIAFRERMHTQREMYSDLKKRFYRFLSKYL